MSSSNRTRSILVLILGLAATAASLHADHLSATSARHPRELADYMAQSVEKIRADLAAGKITPAAAMAALEDQIVIAQAGAFAFGQNFNALGADGGTLLAAFNSAQQLLVAARAGLSAGGTTSLVDRRLTTAKAALEVVSAGLTAGGTANLGVALLAVLNTLNLGPAAAVSAASYTAPVAGDSIATAFGNNLASGTTLARFDAQGNLPVTLGGALVTVGGQPARLISASPTQVSFIMPALAPGQFDVVVSTDAGGAAVGNVNISSVAPGVFSYAMNGRGEGVMVNGVTGARGPFAVTTPQNPGSDKRTRLSVYATGVRNAAGLPQAVEATIGGLRVDTEFAGKHPSLAGLDQINLVVPAALRNAGVLNVRLKVGDQLSNVVTAAFAEAGALIHRLSPSSAAAESQLQSAEVAVIVDPAQPETALVEAGGLPAGAEFSLFAGRDLAAAMSADARLIGVLRADAAGRARASFRIAPEEIGVNSTLALRAGAELTLITTGELRKQLAAEVR
jgi:uncharacterized protein (TIGR03437 family)